MTTPTVHSGTAIRRFLAANAWLVYAFLYLPIVVLIIFSFNANPRNVSVWTGWTVSWYGEVFNNAALMDALKNSLIVAFIATAVSTVLGTAAALSLERFRYRGQRAYDGLLYMPVIIPDVTMAVMMLLFFAQTFSMIQGATGARLGFGLGTISLSHIAFNISFVAIVVRARLSMMDPSLEEAASDLYAGRWNAFRKVTLPIILPGVLGGALLALTLSLDDVVVTSFVTGPGSTTLPVYVFGLVRRGVSPLINAVSVIMLVASMILVMASLFAQRVRSKP